MIPPESKDTSPYVPAPLLYLSHLSHEPVLAIFSEEDFVKQNFVLLIHYVERAFEFVESDDPRIVVLGLESVESDPGYGCNCARTAN